jgi:hypothetical protein
VSDFFGNWTFGLHYTPASNQRFRYRNSENFGNNLILEDAFGDFVLIKDPAGSIELNFLTDYSKLLGISFDYNNNRVRGSKAYEYQSEIYWKAGSDLILKYSLGYINISGSPYQEKYEQIIHRLQVEYNISDRFNIRGIIQPNQAKLPDNNNYESKMLAYNLTLSWEYYPGSFVYFVYNKYKDTEHDGINNSEDLTNEQTLALKINKYFSF